MDIRSAAKLGPRVQLKCEEGTRTKQAFRDECDINNIMAKYQRSGAISHFNRHAGSYGFADAVTFHEASNIVLQANAMFMDLPSKLRQRFNHDPGEFLAFVQDEDNRDEMARLGLLKELPESVDAAAAPTAATPDLPEDVPAGAGAASPEDA